jgi:hypothetical protein
MAMARTPNRDDGYGLQSSAWTGPSRRGGNNPPPSPLPAAPPQVDDESFRWEVAAIADGIAAETIRLPFGSSFTATASYDGPQRRAASVTLRRLPPMTIEEAVKADLLSVFGVNQAVYQTTREAIEALVAQEEESRR